MIVRSLLSFALGLLVAIPVCRVQSHGRDGERPILLAVNKGDQNIVLVDPVTHQILDAIPTGGNTAHEIAASPDGRFAFAPIYGNSGVGKPGTDGDFIAVIDLTQKKVVHRIEFAHGVRPHLPVYDIRRNLLYVSTELDQSITIIDPRSFQIVGSIPTGRPESHMFVLSHDGHLAYTTNVGSGSISVLALDTRKIIGLIPVAAKIQRIAITQDDRSLITADATKPELDVVDTSLGTHPIARYPLPAMAYGTLVLPDGNTLLVTLPSLNKVAVFDLRAGIVTRSVDVCTNPQELVLQPDNPNLAYVSCMTSGQVGVLDVVQGKQLAVIDTGHGTDGLNWAIKH